MKLTKISASNELKIDSEIKEGANITINQFQVINNETNIPLSKQQQLMWMLLESLPQPKLYHLRMLAFQTIFDKFQQFKSYTTKTSEYLGGMQRTYMCRMAKELKDKNLFNGGTKS